MSYPVCDAGRVRKLLRESLDLPAPERIARFGDAELIRHLNGRFELRGGSPRDVTAAWEWCSLFLHDAVWERPLPAASPPLPEQPAREPLGGSGRY